jgi:hypothetical protein
MLHIGSVIIDMQMFLTCTHGIDRAIRIFGGDVEDGQKYDLLVVTVVCFALVILSVHIFAFPSL